jgi:pSer/pThr/pTyr-binding forkhead associated (FHA) protein
MRVVLQVVDGPHKGQHRVLHANQVLRVGRSDWAELSCSLDESLSRLHFEVKSTADGCELTDLKSRNGTRVNGRPIERVLLRDGDEIEAGLSRFRLGVSGDNPMTASSKSDLRYVKPVSDPKLAAGLKGRLAVRCEKTTLPCGWTLIRGKCDDAGPAVVADLLQQLMPLWLIYDPARAEGGPELPQPPAYLFDHLAPEAAAQVSPVFLEPANNPEWPALIEAAWGKDAFLGLLSTAGSDQLLPAFRKACRSDDGESVVGICWPKLLGAVLLGSPSRVVDRYLTGIDGVFFEDADDPATWLLASREDLSDKLLKFGISSRPPEPATVPSMAAVKE